jgi:hypothetical protein
MPVTNTFAAMSARGFGFGTEDSFGEQTYTDGTFSFVVPAGVTSISVVAVAGGGGGVTPGSYTGGTSMPVIWATPPGSASGTVYAGGGGALAYTNNISVTPGQVLTVVAGGGGIPGSITFTAGDGGESYIANAGGTKYVHVTGGYGGQTGGGGGSVVIGTGGAGGAGGVWLITGLALAAAVLAGILALVARVAIIIKTVLAVVAVQLVAALVVHKLRMRRVGVAHIPNMFLALVALVVV